jgi:hypothetical protein
MKPLVKFPLCNVPSWGTLRAGPQWVIVFLVVAVLGPTAIVSLLVLAPVLPVLGGIYWKKPAWAWRSALLVCMAASTWLMVNSPLYGDRYALFEFSNDPLGYKAAITTPVLLAIIAEIPLLPLIVVSVVHSRRSRRCRAGGKPKSDRPTTGIGEPG